METILMFIPCVLLAVYASSSSTLHTYTPPILIAVVFLLLKIQQKSTYLLFFERNQKQRHFTIHYIYQILQLLKTLFFKNSEFPILQYGTRNKHGPQQECAMIEADVKVKNSNLIGNYILNERGVPLKLYKLLSFFDRQNKLWYSAGIQWDDFTIEKLLKDQHIFFAYFNQKMDETNKVDAITDGNVNEVEVTETCDFVCKHLKPGEKADNCLIYNIFKEFFAYSTFIVTANETYGTLSIGLERDVSTLLITNLSKSVLKKQREALQNERSYVMNCDTAGFNSSREKADNIEVQGDRRAFKELASGSIECSKINIDASLLTQLLGSCLVNSHRSLMTKVNHQSSILVASLLLPLFLSVDASISTSHPFHILKFLPFSMLSSFCIALILRYVSLPVASVLQAEIMFFISCWISFSISDSYGNPLWGAAFCTCSIIVMRHFYHFFLTRFKGVFSFTECWIFSQCAASVTIATVTCYTILHMRPRSYPNDYTSPAVELIIKLFMHLIFIILIWSSSTHLSAKWHKIQNIINFVIPVTIMAALSFNTISDAQLNGYYAIHWIFIYIFQNETRFSLLVLWSCVTIGWIMLLFKRSLRFQKMQVPNDIEATSNIRKKIVLLRKEFHGLLVVNCFVALLMDEVELLLMALSVVLWLFIALEIIRISRVYPVVANTVNCFFESVIDERDKNGIVSTHILLLLGVALPLAHEFACHGKIEFRQIDGFIGVFVTGIGDAMAASCGIQWGRRKMPSRNNKSVVGFVALMISVFLSTYAVKQIWQIQAVSLPALMFLSILSALYEVYTDDVDNLHLSLFASITIRASKYVF